MLSERPRAVVTGAAGGLGRSFAKRLAERGGHIVACDVDEKGLGETRALVESTGGRCVTVPCDVARAEDMEKLRDLALAELGAVDLVINNAGVAVGGAVGDIPLADWQWIVGINLMGVVHGCHFFAPHMKERRAGHILNVASIAGFVHAPDMAPYNATKAAVVALTETLSVELAPHGVGATVLCPYFFRTNIARASRSHSTRGEPSQIEKIMDQSRLSADDVAALALKACEQGEFYCFPHNESKVLQALKRAVPGLLRDHLIPRAQKMIEKA